MEYTQIEEIIEENEDETIDITTDGNNLFFANGILTHNSGFSQDLKNINFSHISESAATSHVSDFLIALGNNEDQLLYQNEVHYKILKNRLGGRIGLIDKFFIDYKSLKMYDSLELEKWLEDSKISGATRELAEK